MGSDGEEYPNVRGGSDQKGMEQAPALRGADTGRVGVQGPTNGMHPATQSPSLSTAMTVKGQEEPFPKAKLSDRAGSTPAVPGLTANDDIGWFAKLRVDH